MRARKINESLGFERGGGSKKSLGLGAAERWKNEVLYQSDPYKSAYEAAELFMRVVFYNNDTPGYISGIGERHFGIETPKGEITMAYDPDSDFSMEEPTPENPLWPDYIPVGILLEDPEGMKENFWRIYDQYKRF